MNISLKELHRAADALSLESTTVQVPGFKIAVIAAASGEVALHRPVCEQRPRVAI